VPLVPKGPRKIAGGKLAVGERSPRIRSPEWASALEGRRRSVWSGPGFASFFPRPSRAQSPSARPSGGCARRLACPRLFSVVPPGQRGTWVQDARHVPPPRLARLVLRTAGRLSYGDFGLTSGRPSRRRWSGRSCTACPRAAGEGWEGIRAPARSRFLDTSPPGRRTF